jgi:hypothetical protein
MTALVKRATGLGAAEHLRAAAGPLMASACMGAALIAMGRALPDHLPATVRMAILVPGGAVIFLGAAWSFDRRAMKSLLGFVASVAGPPGVLPPAAPGSALESK